MSEEKTERPYPQLRLDFIDTTDEHVRGFGHVHPMEIREQSTHHVTGTEWIHREHLQRETYTLVTPDIGEWIFDVTSIKLVLARRLPEFRMLRAHLTQEWVDYTIRTSSVEEAGVASLKAEDLDRPGIMIWFGEGRSSQIDGAHRLVRSWREGRKTFDLALLDVRDAAAFMCVPGQEEHLFEVAKTLETKLGLMYEPGGRVIAEKRAKIESSLDSGFIEQARRDVEQQKRERSK